MHLLPKSVSTPLLDDDFDDLVAGLEYEPNHVNNPQADIRKDLVELTDDVITGKIINE